MAKRTYGGVSGSAVLFGTAGLYLAYVGIKNVPFFEGLRSLLRQEKPVPKTSVTGPNPFSRLGSTITPVSELGEPSGKDTGIDKLVGYAAAAYPKFKGQFPNLTIGGWRSVGSVPNSDHPKGKALDIMHPTDAQAAAIIFIFSGMPGANYWIWKRKKASKSGGWQPKAYLGPSPHIDHVHLSFY